MSVDPHCSASAKCWEHWETEPRVSERAVNLALDLVQLRAATDRSRLYEAVCMLQSLLRRQWCEMVRRPFDFPAPKPTSVSKPRPTLSDLDF